jgi:hypothetical protein
LLAERFEHAGQLDTAAVDDGDLIAIAHKIGDRAHRTVEERRSFKACAT